MFLNVIIINIIFLNLGNVKYNDDDDDEEEMDGFGFILEFGDFEDFEEFGDFS